MARNRPSRLWWRCVQMQLLACCIFRAKIASTGLCIDCFKLRTTLILVCIHWHCENRLKCCMNYIWHIMFVAKTAVKSIIAITVCLWNSGASVELSVSNLQDDPHKFNYRLTEARMLIGLSNVCFNLYFAQIFRDFACFLVPSADVLYLSIFRNVLRNKTGL